MEILNKIQQHLKAPKNQRNTFGNYNYRSCEDILEAVKPLLGNTTLTLTDEIVMIGDRFYVKATATLSDKEKSVSVAAYAREDLTKKGMDVAQITGAASSYARKYALNGLFCIDDTKDADTEKPNGNIEYISEKQAHEILDWIASKNIDLAKFCKAFNIESPEKLPKERFDAAIDALKKAKGKQ